MNSSVLRLRLRLRAYHHHHRSFCLSFILNGKFKWKFFEKCFVYANQVLSNSKQEILYWKERYNQDNSYPWATFQHVLYCIHSMSSNMLMCRCGWLGGKWVNRKHETQKYKKQQLFTTIRQSNVNGDTVKRLTDHSKRISWLNPIFIKCPRLHFSVSTYKHTFIHSYEHT